MLIKFFKWCFLLVSISIVLIYVSMSLLINHEFLLTETVYSAYISGLLSFLGGLVGGIVAFTVARYQIQNDKKIIKSDKIKYFKNILRVLINELKHNQRILELIIIEETEVNKIKYIHLLESDAWQKFRFSEYNYLPNDIYSIIDELYREFKDIKEGKLPEYEKILGIDFSKHVKVVISLIEKIGGIEQKNQDSII
ncbi:hypothetical protein FH505_07105 [Bacillus velezensis]|uniref:hypothetical protein n=1 Tax=Bacillus TaxID=1386 RepID=UPI0006244180|nr:MULTISPECIES: hypothetical protein [Bacillus subtilis group]AKF31441.1 hypothetical protein AAV29_13105 [Bacillus velezensis]MBR8693484.1 hypothetical protein [Bacillus velezensis]MBY6041186.1 hypothetical protein [Bacillus velezensis]MCA1239283.1 hypothetical protein [Bacillus velezensis]MCV2521957.1 hypothetical protein [Bacillus velezensis]